MEEYKLLQPAFLDKLGFLIELRDYDNGDYRIIQVDRKAKEEKSLWQGSLRDAAIKKFDELIDPDGDRGRKIESLKARITYKDGDKVITRCYQRLSYAFKFRSKLTKNGIEHEFYSLKEGFKDIKF